MSQELHEAIKQKEVLYQELRKRPFAIKGRAQTVDVDNHPYLTKTMQDLLNNDKRFHAKIKINDEFLWCICIGRIDSHNDNFGNEEEGQIFAGIIDQVPKNNKLKFNDLIEFQSCDVKEVK